ncbi:MAG: T9SS type A sorting domain-containing protein [Salibacteraceae bacterium]
MKKLLSLFIFAGLCLTGYSQITTNKDTVHHYFHPTKQTESKITVTNPSFTPIDVKWKIIYDDIKTEWDTNVQFCDCNTCLTNYPDSSSCNDPLTQSQGFFVKLYIDPIQNPSVKHLTLVLYNINDAMDTDTITFMTDPSIVDGLQESVLANENSVTLAPNPTNGLTKLTYSSSASGSVTVSVYDLLGNVTYNRSVNNEVGTNELDLDLTELDNGIYFVNVTDGHKSFTKKLSIK